MRLRGAFVCLLGCCGTVAGQQVVQVRRANELVVPAGQVLASLEGKTGAAPGHVQGTKRVLRLVDAVLSSEFEGVHRPGVKTVLGLTRGEEIYVKGDKGVIDLAESVLDQMRCEQPARLHVTCTLLVMPVELATSHGLVANRAQQAERDTMIRLMRDVVKAKGVLRNLPEVVTRPFVPFVAEPRVGDGARPLPPNAANLRLRGEAVALGPAEALFAVQFVHGRLPEDRTVMPQQPLCNQAFRLRAGSAVTLMANGDKMAAVMYVRFDGVSSEPMQVGEPAGR